MCTGQRLSSTSSNASASRTGSYSSSDLLIAMNEIEIDSATEAADFDRIDLYQE